jgi:hypothetical protein
LAVELMREADARALSVAINPADLLKTRATGEGRAWAEADLAAAGEAAGSVAGAAAAVVAEVVEEAVAVAAAVAGDDASWRFGPRPKILGDRE